MRLFCKMGNKKNRKIKISTLKKINIAKKICSKIKRNKKGLFIGKNSTEEQLQFLTDADDEKLVCTVQAVRCDFDWISKKSSTIYSAHLEQEDKCSTSNGCMHPKKAEIQVIEDAATKDAHVYHDSKQDVLEDLHSSDLSKELCFETILTLKRKLIEDFNLLEGQDDSILGTNSEVEIQIENPEDVAIPLPNLSSASSSRTNTACGSQTTEPHTVWIPVCESQNTMDITTMKEVPGNPLSYVSIQSHAADSQELAMKMELRKKMEMLKENAQILKRLREEIVTFEMKHKVLIADIKYLQNVAKKKKSHLS